MRDGEESQNLCPLRRLSMRKTERISINRSCRNEKSSRDSEDTFKARKDQIVTLTQDVKNEAKKAGFVAVGISNLDGLRRPLHCF
jgi:hypothetical protein